MQVCENARALMSLGLMIVGCNGRAFSRDHLLLLNSGGSRRIQMRLILAPIKNCSCDHGASSAKMAWQRGGPGFLAGRSPMSHLNPKRNGGWGRGILCARQCLWRLASELVRWPCFQMAARDVDMSVGCICIHKHKGCSRRWG
jgi:hypothetical protein